jgi:tRNA modification GTPase
VELPDRDPIAAIATPQGRGGVGIVRISGPILAPFLNAFFCRTLQPRQAHFLPFLDADGVVIDRGLALYFPAPRSYTGEDVLELHAHGNPLLLDRLLRRALQLGARLADPGEFTLRAYLNGKLDLAQAEAVADLIDSGSEQALRAAQRSLQGEFSENIRRFEARLTELRVYVEAALDFSDEDIDFLAAGEIAAKLANLRDDLAAARRAARQGYLLREGMTLVIAGRPNAGKSSLLNALSGRDSAIVTDRPGTTRDLLREHIQIDGLPLHVIDTAGLCDSDDPVEQEGIRRARAQIEQADRILLLLDDNGGERGEDQRLLEQLPSRIPVTFIHNKIDLSGHPPGLDQEPRGVAVYLSARTGAGLDSLREHLKSCLGYQPESDGAFSARMRHLDALDRAARSLERAVRHTADSRAELVAEELREAHESLGEITGECASDELLGKIFASFCIGK